MPASAFITAVQPNFDSGIGAVPAIITDVPTVPAQSTPLWLLGASFANTTAAQVTARLTDGSGATIVPDVIIPAKSVWSNSWNMLPITGLRWLCSVGAGVNGKVWGYQ